MRIPDPKTGRGILLMEGDTLYTYTPAAHKSVLLQLSNCKYNSLQLTRYVKKDSVNMAVLASRQKEIMIQDSIIESISQAMRLEIDRRKDSERLHEVARQGLKENTRIIASLNRKVKKYRFGARIYKGTTIVAGSIAVAQGIWIWILKSG